MKLLFIGTTPPPGLVSTLLAQGLSVETLPRFPLPPKPAAYDLLVFSPGSPENLGELKAFRKRFPLAWITVLVSPERLTDPAWHTALLECSYKDSVWFEDTWEAAFFLQFQQALNHKALLEEKETLSRETEALQNSSKALIDKLERDVGLAANIQRSLLPKASPRIPGIQLSVKYIPASGQGGDYYDIFEFGDKKRYGILLADSKSHGMAAALLSVLLKIRITQLKDRFPDTQSFVRYINQEIQTLQDRDLAPMALLYCIVDRSRLQIEYCVAGHLNPLLWRGGKPFPLPTHSNPCLGEMNHFDFEQSEVPLLPGDQLLFHTDGLDLPLGGREKMPARARLTEILARSEPTPDPMETQIEILGHIDAYQEKHTLPDDLTFIHLAVDQRALYVTRKKKS